MEKEKHDQKDDKSLTKSSASPSSSSLCERQIDLVFESNRLAHMLFGEFDQNLALLEQKFNIKIIARGNHLTLIGQEASCFKAKNVLDTLYARLKEGLNITQGDVEGAATIALQNPVQKTPVARDHQDLKHQQKGTASHMKMASISTRIKTITARSSAQDIYIRALEKADLIFSTGPAGTGKTYLAVAYAASLLERGLVERIILSRPAVEAGERLGFLPGDMREKIDPYLRPLYDALYDMMPHERVERELEAGVIEIAPLAFMRGRTLSNAAIILDEAQNTTSMQMKMILTRLGERSKMMINGDPKQVDLPSGQQSGLIQATRLLSNIDQIAHIHFTDDDVVRHPLVAAIVRAYENNASSQRSRD